MSAYIYFPPPTHPWSYGTRNIDMVVEIFKYYNCIKVKWQISQITNNLCLNAAKNTYCIKKRKISSTKSCSDLDFIQRKVHKFRTKKSASTYVYPPPLPVPSEAKGLERLIWLKYLYCTEKSNNTINNYISQKCSNGKQNKKTRNET